MRLDWEVRVWPRGGGAACLELLPKSLEKSASSPTGQTVAKRIRMRIQPQSPEPELFCFVMTVPLFQLPLMPLLVHNVGVIKLTFQISKNGVDISPA